MFDPNFSIDGQNRIRLLLADDHTMFREGLARLFSSREGLEVVGQSKNGAEAVALAREKKPDAVIMQVEKPMERAKRNLDLLLSIEPSPKIILATMFEDPNLIRDFTSLGVSAYVTKSASVSQLVDAVTAAVSDKGGDNVVISMPRGTLEPSGDGAGEVLPPRELEILVLTARGRSNRQIAASLRIAEATVKRHLANVYNKIEVGSRGEAMKKALEEGWISLPDVLQER